MSIYNQFTRFEYWSCQLEARSGLMYVFRQVVDVGSEPANLGAEFNYISL